MRIDITLFAAALLTFSVGCGPKDADPAAAPGSTAKAPTSTAAGSTAPASTAAKSDAPKSAAPASAAAAPGAKVEPGAVPQYAGSHILVAYAGAQRAKPMIKRTKDAALAKAKALVKTARGGADFTKLAADNSDGPSAKRGGSLGTWKKGRMVPAFDTAVAAMKIGDISEPVETPFGFHVIKRNVLPEMRAGAHILIAFKGAMRAKPTITRSKDEALAKAKEVMAKARATPADFGKLAGENSDGPSAKRGGSLGTWPKGKMVPEFDKAIDTMKVGDISEPVETGFGFHVIQRLEAK
ncbi:MAG: parvulin-like peptidyl-prolyl isomerase [Bradymonadia bacterium]|jgi:parvulin-like peptidyl-prolyl isomerase